MQNLDMNRLRGSWYEIERLPVKAEKNCVGDAFELIAFGNAVGSLQLVDSCRNKADETVLRTRSAKHSKGIAAEFKIKRLVIFSTQYWVLSMADDDSWLLVGTPNHKNLWVYSKTPAMQPNVLALVTAKAAAQGFAVDKLIASPQSNRTNVPAGSTR